MKWRKGMMENNVLFNLDGKELIIEHLYTVEEYFTFTVRVKSGQFAGSSNFCMPKDEIISLIQTLTVMDKELKGICKVRDFDSDASFVIDMDKYGHVNIYGQIGGSYEDNNLKFKCAVDQTIIVRFIQILKSLL